MQAPITLFIIALTTVVSLLAFRSPRLAGRLILWPPAVDRHKQYDRLIGYGLIHADIWHLLFNMLTLFFAGRFMEQQMYQLSGRAWTFPVFYVSALVVSILPTYVKHQKDPNYRALGASGAVSAMLFALILLRPLDTIIAFVIPMPAILFAVLYVAYSIWMDKRGGDNIAHGAHLAGAAYGVLFMLVMSPQVLGHFLRELGMG